MSTAITLGCVPLNSSVRRSSQLTAGCEALSLIWRPDCNWGRLTATVKVRETVEPAATCTFCNIRRRASDFTVTAVACSGWPNVTVTL